MRPFRAEESTYERSIVIDASTVGNVTVTVAAYAERTDEIAVLDSLYTAADGHNFFPFRDKSHNLNHEDSIHLFENAIVANGHRLKATAHLGHDGSDQERIEAVQSAILVEELQTPEAIVILDGNEDKANRFGNAIRGISSAIPPIATCIQSELYYPTALLADLCASHLAHTIEHPRHCATVEPPAPISKEVYHNHWGKAYNSMVNSSHRVTTECLEQRRAETVSQRVCSWFEGYMGGGEPYSFEQSLQPIIRYVHENGYEELAMQLSEI